MIRLLPLLLLTACATPDAPAREGPVRLGETAYVGGPRVRPLALVEDSRCPTNARCVWAGRVVIDATVSTGGGDRTMRLTLGDPVAVADGMLTLVSATPERVAGKRVAPAAYRFGFAFEGGY